MSKLMKRTLLLGAPLLGVFIAAVYPVIEILGVGKPVLQVNNQKCQHISGLEACEDAFVNYDNGQAYLPCSSRKSRQAWLPAILHLNASALPAQSSDYVAVLDIESGQHHRLELVASDPQVQKELNLHGIDVYHRDSDRQHLTVFLNSHRTPKDRSQAPKIGADSVVEIFETRVGSKELKHVKTVRHPLIRTPNNVVAMGERQFYVTNDHRHRVHWARAFGIFYHIRSDIIYCDATTETPTCTVAAEGVYNPNGIARGPKDLLYSASSGETAMTVWEIQSGDHSLVPVDRVKIGSVMDNLHVGEDGSIYVNTFPKPIELLKLFTAGGFGGIKSPTASVRVRNQTGESRHLGDRYAVDVAFADDGTYATGPTSCVPYKNKLILTGVMTEHVTICDIA